MNTNWKLTLAAVTIIFLNLALALSSCQKGEAADITKGEVKTAYGANRVNSDCNCIVNPSDTVCMVEIEMLQHMREEEKLARDVYLTMYALYPVQIFNNISKSEQNHMNQVLCLLEYYNITDPASAEIGVFTDPELQALYNNLIAQGSLSLVDALFVGATIEDMDIYDLEEHVAATSNEAIINIFERLSCASGNHMRSFTSLLNKKGVIYAPQYISQEEYEVILNTPHQQCGR